MDALRPYKRSDYIDPPKALAAVRNGPTAPSGKRGWPKGWPDNCPSRAVLVTPEIVRPSDGKVLGRPVHGEVALLYGEVFTYAMLLDPTWELRGAAEPSGGQGGVACRAIKKSNPPAPSNHSSGTAWDCNTKSNGMRVGKNGATVKFVSTQSPILIELAAEAFLYWGGWYWDARHHKTGKRFYTDAMHFEYMGRPEDVPAHRAALRALFEKKWRELHPDPPQEDPDVDKAKVLAAQKAYNTVLDALGSPAPRLVEDGIWGQVTDTSYAGLGALVLDALRTRDNALRAGVRPAIVDLRDAVNALSGRATTVIQQLEPK